MLLAELQAQAKQLKQAEDSANQVLALDKNNIAAMSCSPIAALLGTR